MALVKEDLQLERHQRAVISLLKMVYFVNDDVFKSVFVLHFSGQFLLEEFLGFLLGKNLRGILKMNWLLVHGFEFINEWHEYFAPWVHGHCRRYSGVGISDLQGRGATHRMPAYDYLSEVDVCVGTKVQDLADIVLVFVHFCNKLTYFPLPSLHHLVPHLLLTLIDALKYTIIVLLTRVKLMGLAIGQFCIVVRSIQMVNHEHDVAVARKLLASDLVVSSR